MGNSTIDLAGRELQRKKQSISIGAVLFNHRFIPSITLNNIQRSEWKIEESLQNK